MKKNRFSLLLASYIGLPTLVFLGGTAFTYAHPLPSRSLAQAAPVETTQPVAPENATPQPAPDQPLQPGEVREEIAPEWQGDNVVRGTVKKVSPEEFNRLLNSGRDVPAEPEQQGSETTPGVVPPQPQQPENQENQSGQTNVTSPGGLKRFDFTIVNDYLSIEFFDAGAEQDGDVIRPVLEAEDGTILSGVEPILLTKGGYSTAFRLNYYKGGTYKLRVIPVSGGKTPVVTVGVRIPERFDGTSGGTVQRIGTADTGRESIGPGQEVVFTLGVPQIAVCTTPRPNYTGGDTNPNYPCAKNGNAHPESAAHIEEARRVPPSPITAPLKSGVTEGNLVPAVGYPRLLTIDRAGADARRNLATKRYDCSGVQGIDRPEKDEYPQALFKDGGSRSHIKCVTGSDNGGSGASVRGQLNGYNIPRKDGSLEYFGKLPDDYLVEIVTIP